MTRRRRPRRSILTAGFTREISRAATKRDFSTSSARSKDMFISGGVNVYPIEVEAELLRHEAICDATVVGVPHAIWGEVGVAFVVSARQIRAFG